MTTRQRATPDEKIQYLIVDGEGEFVVEVPASWKVTFGWVNPSAHGGPGMTRGDGHCVRIWEGEKLRAVFDGARRLRDLSIPLARKVKSETGSAAWSKDSSGNFEESSKRLIEESFEADDNVIPFGS